LTGRSLREVSVLVAQMGLVPHFSGRGPVVGSQNPAPGTEVASGNSCEIVFTEEPR